MSPSEAGRITRHEPLRALTMQLERSLFGHGGESLDAGARPAAGAGGVVRFDARGARAAWVCIAAAQSGRGVVRCAIEPFL